MTQLPHEPGAYNCVYNNGEVVDVDACPACPVPDVPPDEPDDPSLIVEARADGVTERKVDPIKFEEQFTDFREQVRARFSPIQITQAQHLQVESVSEDFIHLAQRITVEVNNKSERDEALRLLELAYLMTLRGLTYG